MKVIFQKLSILFVFLFLASFGYSQSIVSLTEFLKAEKNDASNLMKSYLTPGVNAISNGVNSGWYNTAKTHKPLGFDLSFSFSAVFTPTSDNYFKPTLSPSTTFTNATVSGAGAPSVVGPADKTSYASTYDPDGSGPLPSQTFTFSGPEGLDLKKNIGFSALPVPIAQLGIGVIKNTDLKIRFVPEINGNTTSFKMFGIGLQHDIKQYLPGVKELPFDLSVLAAFNSMSGSSSLVNSVGVISTDGQLSYKLNAWTLQALISKKVSILTMYAALGYGSVSSNVDITGTFLVPASPTGFSVKNPLSMSLSTNSFRVTTGLRLKFGPFFLNGDYTFQSYNALTVGFGLAFR